MEKKKENPLVMLLIGIVVLLIGFAGLAGYGKPGVAGGDVIYSIVWLFSGAILTIVGLYKFVFSRK